MLTYLYIENMAVIKKAEVNFGKNLNILTGETGAGKSIVIDSINAVLGRRICKDIIRPGEDKAVISATFTDLNNKALIFLKENGFFPEDGNIIIERQFSLSGKSLSKINGRPIPLSILKTLGNYLVNIHGQHESYDLFSEDTHIKYLDKFAHLENDLKKYKEKYEELKSIETELHSLKINETEKLQKIDLLNYQINEILSANLSIGELEKLNERKNFLLNKEKISKAFLATNHYLIGNENSLGAISLLEMSFKKLENISNIYPEIGPILDRLNNISIETRDCQQEISGLFDEGDESDYTTLNDVEDRLALISNLSRKYGEKIEDILTFLENAEKELKTIKHSDEKISELEKKYQDTLKNTQSLAKELSEKRKISIQKFTDSITKELEFLEMPNVKFKIICERCELCPTGYDKIEFLISTNLGQNEKSISKVASGGELSRIMLSVKNIISYNDESKTLIFDEIDSGISGSAAEKVGARLKKLSKSSQIILVTHLIQIASFADDHFLVTKNSKNNETFAFIKKLDSESRKYEIARITNGSHVSDLSLKNAAEILARAKKI